MKRLTLILLGVVVAAIAMAQDPAPTSTADQLASATAAYESAEKDMDAAYAKLRTAVDVTGKKRLEASQRAWAGYRDAQAEFNCFYRDGNTTEKMEYYAQLRKQTEKRTRDLEQTYQWVRELLLKRQ
jgi:uncharacterized protein YecT (DUF1311 family)